MLVKLDWEVQILNSANFSILQGFFDNLKKKYQSLTLIGLKINSFNSADIDKHLILDDHMTQIDWILK